VDEREGKLLTTTSRSLGIVGIGATIADAEQRAEAALGAVKGEHDVRHDIGRPALLDRRIAHMRELMGARPR